jgi:hypothetical protein
MRSLPSSLTPPLLDASSAAPCVRVQFSAHITVMMPQPEIKSSLRLRRVATRTARTRSKWAQFEVWLRTPSSCRRKQTPFHSYIRRVTSKKQASQLALLMNCATQRSIVARPHRTPSHGKPVKSKHRRSLQEGGGRGALVMRQKCLCHRTWTDAVADQVGHSVVVANFSYGSRCAVPCRHSHTYLDSKSDGR